MHNGGRSPPINVLDRFIFVHILTVPGKMDRGNFNLLLLQKLGDLIRAEALDCQPENLSYHNGCFFVHNPVIPIFVP